jgi:hypothetical protein
MTPRFTRGIAIVASLLCVPAVFLLGLASQAENRPPDAPSMTGPVILILGAALSAWLAHIWLRQGWESHANVAEALTFVLVVLGLFFLARGL